MREGPIYILPINWHHIFNPFPGNLACKRLVPQEVVQLAPALWSPLTSITSIHGGGYHNRFCSPQELALTEIKEEKFSGWRKWSPMPKVTERPRKRTPQRQAEKSIHWFAEWMSREKGETVHLQSFQQFSLGEEERDAREIWKEVRATGGFYLFLFFVS